MVLPSRLYAQDKTSWEITAASCYFEIRGTRTHVSHHLPYPSSANVTLPWSGPRADLQEVNVIREPKVPENEGWSLCTNRHGPTLPNVCTEYLRTKRADTRRTTINENSTSEGRAKRFHGIIEAKHEQLHHRGIHRRAHEWHAMPNFLPWQLRLRGLPRASIKISAVTQSIRMPRRGE